MGRRAIALQADFTDVDEVFRLEREAEEFLGRVDVLINNAGITTNIPYEKVKPEQFDTLFNVNIKAMYFMTQAVAKGTCPATASIQERPSGMRTTWFCPHLRYSP